MSHSSSHNLSPHLRLLTQKSSVRNVLNASEFCFMGLSSWGQEGHCSSLVPCMLLAAALPAITGDPLNLIIAFCSSQSTLKYVVLHNLRLKPFTSSREQAPPELRQPFVSCYKGNAKGWSR